MAQFITSPRTLDGLHLALAAVNDLALVSLDRQLLEAATCLGVKTIPVV